MKNTSKILVLVLVLAMLTAVFAITANAAATAGQTWSVVGTLVGTWEPGSAPEMTYDESTGAYVYVINNVKAGKYEYKVIKDKSWGVKEYPSSGNYNITIEKDGSTVTITFDGSKVTPTVVAPSCDHAYVVSAETVTCLAAGTRTWTCSVCSDSYTEDLAALGHHYDATGKCERCDETVEFVRVYVDNAAKWADVYCYTWDTNPYVAWPGEKMQLDSESGLYYYDIPKHFVNVIFNNASGTQSANLKTPTGTATIYNNSTKTWKAPHVCEFSEPTCTAPGKCSVCGKTQGEALGHQWEDATCVAPKTCSVCSATEGEALGHNFKRGACTRCEEVDPNYVAPAPSPLVMDFTTWEAYPEFTYAVGDLQVYNQYFTFIHNEKSRIDGSTKEFGDGFYATQRFTFGGAMPIKTDTPKVPNKSALMVTAPTSGKITVWWISGGNDRFLALLDAEGKQIAIAEESVKDGKYVTTFVIPAAGTYYLGNTGNNYWFQVKLELDACAEHTWDEGAITTYPTCKTPGVFTNTCKVCAATTTTELPASADYHYYVLDICAFCYDIRPTIVLGENTVTVPAAGSAFGMIQITEAGTYSISDADNAIVCIFKHNIFAAESDFSIAKDGTLGASWYAFDTTAVLEPGYYYIGVYGVGEHKVTINKHIDPATCEHTYVYMNCTKCGTANPNFAHNIMSVGANKVVCNQYHLVDKEGHGNPYQFTSFTVTEAGHYKFVSDKAVGFTIFTTEVTAPGADFTPITGESWKTFVAGNEVDLQPGTYMIGLIFIDGEGEYNITLEKVVEEPVVEEEPEELNFFQKIIAWIMNLINSILGIFKK